MLCGAVKEFLEVAAGLPLEAKSQQLSELLTTLQRTYSSFLQTDEALDCPPLDEVVPLYMAWRVRTVSQSFPLTNSSRLSSSFTGSAKGTVPRGAHQNQHCSKLFVWSSALTPESESWNSMCSFSGFSSVMCSFCFQLLCIDEDGHEESPSVVGILDSLLAQYHAALNDEIRYTDIVSCT